MSKSIIETGRIGTVRSGRTVDGAQKNNKAIVWGRINVKSYTADGESLTPKELGLETVDWAQFEVQSVNDAVTVPTTTVIPTAVWIRSTNLLVINVNMALNTVQNTTSQDAVVNFQAAGDALVADLT